MAWTQHDLTHHWTKPKGFSITVRYTTQKRFTRRLDELPGQPIASQGLGLIALHRHASAAVELLQMAAIGQPDDAAIHTHLGLAFGAAGDQASSEACLRKAIDLAPSFADAHLNR